MVYPIGALKIPTDLRGAKVAMPGFIGAVTCAISRYMLHEHHCHPIVVMMTTMIIHQKKSGREKPYRDFYSIKTQINKEKLKLIENITL